MAELDALSPHAARQLLQILARKVSSMHVVASYSCGTCASWSIALFEELYSPLPQSELGGVRVVPSAVASVCCWAEERR